MNHRFVRPGTDAGYAYAIDQHFTAKAGADQKSGTVLPGKIKVLLADAGTGDYEVTGPQRSENAFAGDGKPSARGQVLTAGKNDKLTNISGSGKAFKTLAPFFTVGVMPGESKEKKHQGKKSKKPA